LPGCVVVSDRNLGTNEKNTSTLQEGVMTTSKASPDKPEDLRRRAQTQLKSRTASPEKISPEEAQFLLQELQVHQVELEMQNEQLDHTQAELETALTRYTDLYDFAPVAYLTLDNRGCVLQANLTAARLLGTERSRLVQQPLALFIRPEDKQKFWAYLVAVIQGQLAPPLELHLQGKGQAKVAVQLHSLLVPDAASRPQVRTSLIDVTARQRAEEARAASCEKLERSLSGTIQALSTTVERRDPYTAGHQRRVSQLAAAISQEMGFSLERIEGMKVLGLLHDIGKVAVPAEIFSKPGQLSAGEFDLVKTHAQEGYEIVKGLEFPWPIAQSVLQHHERLDGSGYPQGLIGPDISPCARILAVADVVEAMVSQRPYRPALGINQALEEISHNRGVLYDPEVVDVCVKLFTGKSFQFD
jgi:PAS domain S-box-containing protein/putative nucleotidyltransferase with HDIG domain